MNKNGYAPLREADTSAHSDGGVGCSFVLLGQVQKAHDLRELVKNAVVKYFLLPSMQRGRILSVLALLTFW